MKTPRKWKMWAVVRDNTDCLLTVHLTQLEANREAITWGRNGRNLVVSRIEVREIVRRKRK